MSTPAALYGIECACYMAHSFCNLCRNGVARQAAKEIAPCNTTLSRGVLDESDMMHNTSSVIY